MSNYADPIKITKVDVDKITLQFPKEGTTKSSGMFVYPKHNKTKLRAILPDVTAPFGAGPQKDYPNRFSMGITFDEADDDTDAGRKQKNAYDVLVAINDKCRQLMLENREAFFKDAVRPEPSSKKDPKKKNVGVSDEVIESRYKSFFRERGEDQSDIMYLTLQTKRISQKDRDEGKYTPEQIARIEKEFISLPDFPLLVDASGSPIEVNVDNITKAIPWNSRVRPVIEFAYLWCTQEKVTPVWTFVHGARKSTGVSKGFNILKDDDDEDEEISRMEEDENENQNEENGGEEENEEGGDGEAMDEEEQELAR